MKNPIMAIFMRTDLNMSRGKMAVQAGHAVAIALRWSPVQDTKSWMEQQQVKVVLAVNDEISLIKILAQAKENGLIGYLVADAGKTEVEPGSNTCCVLGPYPRKRVDKITAGFKALK